MTTLTNEQIFSRCAVTVENALNYSELLHAQVAVMHNIGCRVSECCDKSLWSYLGAGNWQLQTLKRGNYRTIDETILPDRFINWLNDSTNSMHFYPSKTLRRALLNIAPAPILHCEGKRINSHLFRHSYIKQIYDLGMSIPDISEHMGLMTTETPEHYINSIIYY